MRLFSDQSIILAYQSIHSLTNGINPRVDLTIRSTMQGSAHKHTTNDINEKLTME